MFGMYRYFAISSAVVILVAMVVLGIGYQRLAINTLVEVAESSNVTLAETLSNLILSRFTSYRDIGSDDADAAALHAEADRVTELLHAVTADTGFLKAKIYNARGLTLYSTDPAEIGSDRLSQPHSSAFLSAAQDGEPQSKLSFEDRISAFSGEIFNRDVVETYVPIADRTGDIIGVFELYADVTDLKNSIDRIVPGALLVLLIVFLAVYGFLVLVVMRRAMAPLQLASTRAAAIGPRSPEVRLPTEGMAAEVLPLIEAINGALDRLDTALEAQRQFTADAAHELLTPLAVLKANLDILKDDSAADLRQDVTAMSDVVTQLLELAELDAVTADASEAVVLSDICIEVAAMMAPVAHKQNKDIEFSDAGSGTVVRCCSRSLTRALRNLVENAIAVTPPGTTVGIHLDPDGAIRVVDHGPGVPAGERETIFQRFWRGSHGDRPGAGLGLSIVKRFVESYGGTVEVGDAPGGGAQFTMRLPHSGSESASLAKGSV